MHRVRVHFHCLSSLSYVKCNKEEVAEVAEVVVAEVAEVVVA